MIRRVTRISVVGHKLKLGIKHEKALREQTAVSDKAAALARDIRTAVQKVGQLGDTAVRDKGSSVRIRAQRCGPGDGGAVDRARAQIQASEHVVEQFRTAAGSRGVERLEKTLVEHIHRVQLNSSPKPRSFGTDVGNPPRQLMAELPQNFEIEDS